MDSHDFHKLLLSRGTFFCYSGLLSEEVLTAISSIVREQVTDIDHDEDLTTRVFGIFIEQAQNIIRYSDERLAQGGIGTVAIGHTSEGFVVEAINPMKGKAPPTAARVRVWGSLRLQENPQNLNSTFLKALSCFLSLKHGLTHEWRSV